MEHYVGLDVSLKLTAICIVDRTGKIEREGVVSSDPEAIAIFIKSHAPHVVRVGLETGATATWLWTELNKLGLPVICIDARHAKAALKMQINKSDRNDAVGIARIMQCGWYKEVHVKDLRQSRGQGPSRQQSSTRQDQARSGEPDPRAPQEPRARYWPSEDERICRPCCGVD